MIIGVDACGSFESSVGSDGLTCSAVAAATLTATARAEIAQWTTNNVGGADPELHAAPMNWDQRLAVCEMLGARGDVHAAVVATHNLLLTSVEAVAKHRRRQLVLAEQALARATTDEGVRRGERAVRLLSGRRLGRSRLRDQEFVLAAMVPPAVMGAVQRAFCFYAGAEFRDDMQAIDLVMDDETPATIRYVTETFLATIGGDDRFRLVTPEHWRDPPVHPLLTAAAHPDGGYRPQRLVGPDITWVSSVAEPAVQVADFAAWIVCRTIARPDEPVARQAFDLLHPILVGEAGRCFDIYGIGLPVPDELLFGYLHSAEQPAEWLTSENTALQD